MPPEAVRERGPANSGLQGQPTLLDIRLERVSRFLLLRGRRKGSCEACCAVAAHPVANSAHLRRKHAHCDQVEGRRWTSAVTAAPSGDTAAAAPFTAMQQVASSFAGRTLAFQPAAVQQRQRTQLRVVAKDSRIGKVPIAVPEKVNVTIKGQHVHVKVRCGRWRCGRAGRTAQQPAAARGGGRQRRLEPAAVPVLALLLRIAVLQASDVPCWMAALQGPRGELERSFHPEVVLSQVRAPPGPGQTGRCQAEVTRGVCAPGSMRMRSWWP